MIEWKAFNLGKTKDGFGTVYMIMAENEGMHNAIRTLEYRPDLVPDSEWVWHCRGAINSMMKEVGQRDME